MFATRAILSVVMLAFLGVTAFRLLRSRPVEQVETPSTNQPEASRAFWSAYKKAGQRRSSGDLPAAIEFYQKALVLRPNHEDSLYYLGNCHFERGEYAEASVAYRRLIAVNPQGSSRGYMQLGLIHAGLEPEAPRNLAEARRYFEQSLQVDPDSGALLCLGEVAVLEGQWLQAWKYLEGANADNAMSMAAPFLLGYLCFRDGRDAEAWKWFRLAVQRGELKKPAVKWTEEGDVKADPELRWRALARQSVFGRYWISLRGYLKSGYGQEDMRNEYRRLQKTLAGLLA
ncbi:MAG: tetratricopeptide repeat protein [Acidimicrobiia bacterium]|nr:tetratricopeptide repeat protein [Acidimicrobiia bacterium]